MIGRLIVLGAGVALGVWGVRRVNRVQRALMPGGADDLGARLRHAIAQGRAAAAAKEAELRATYGVGDARR